MLISKGTFFYHKTLYTILLCIENKEVTYHSDSSYSPMTLTLTPITGYSPKHRFTYSQCEAEYLHHLDTVILEILEQGSDFTRLQTRQMLEAVGEAEDQPTTFFPSYSNLIQIKDHLHLKHIIDNERIATDGYSDGTTKARVLRLFNLIHQRQFTPASFLQAPF